MNELLAHLIGDYLTQSDWMANDKTSKSTACICHALVYGIGFFIIGASWTALFIIVLTHFLIDRFRLAKYLIYAKNFLAPPSVYLSPYWFSGESRTDYNHEPDGYNLAKKYRWANCKATGYPSETPQFLAVWLLIIADNTLHLLINHLALKYL